MEAMQQKMKAYMQQIDRYLADAIPSTPTPYEKLTNAMSYSLTAGGKRLRPILTMEFCRLCGGDSFSALPVGCGVEMLHTYTLIHDDMPCMDNDDMRRGRPSNHKVFGECTATLAGDALQALAFETVLDAELPAEARAGCALLLAKAAGYNGICGGQQIDIEWEGRSLTAQELHQIHSRKTSALFQAACQMGVVAAGGTPLQEQAAVAYAQHMGLAFQVRDDMLDVIADQRELGKPIGSDRDEGKTTFVDLIGLSGCEALVEEESGKAKEALAVFEDPSFLCDLTDSLVNRKK